MANIVVDLIARDLASAKIAGFNRNVKTLGETTGKYGAVLSAVAIGAMAVSAKMAATFEESTTKLITGAGESVKNIEKVRDGLLEMAPAVAMGPEALAKGMFLVESAGFHGAAGLLVMKAAAEGAAVGGAEAATVADGLTTAMNDYQLPASQAAKVTSQLITTVSLGKTHMEDLSGSLGAILPIASSLKIKLPDIAGAMATMTARGIDAATASTNLKFAIMAMANETPKGAAALKSVGLSSSEVASSLTKNGLKETLAMITEAIGKKFPVGSAQYTAALANIVGGTRGMGAALSLTGANMATYDANVKKIAGSTTEAGNHVKGFSKTQEDAAFKLKQAGAGVQALGVGLGNILLPIVTNAAKVGAKWVGVLNEHKPALMTILTIVGALGVALLVTSAAMKIIIAVQTAVKVATIAWTAVQWLLNVALNANPIGVVIMLVAGLVAIAIVLISNWKTIGPFFMGLWKTVANVFVNAWHGIVAGVTNGWNQVMSFFHGIPGAIAGFFGGIGRWLWDAGANLIHGLINGAASILRGIGNFFLSILPGWIVGPFKAALGIRSPSTVFFGHGANIVHGLVNGITANKSKIADVMTTLVPAPTIQGMNLGRAAAAGSGYGGSGGGLYIDKFIGGSASPAQIATELGWMGRWAT